jgi:hypothetical protein
MTLVIACLTEKAVYQVSDRRLTSFTCPDTVIDDERNKAVVVNSRVAFAYSGLSAIGGERSDDWVARVIADGPTNDMAQVTHRIKERATRDFQQLNIASRFKHHAFQGVGWFRLKGEDWLSPGVITIDNAIDHQTGTWLAEPRVEFQVTTQFPSKLPGSCILNSVGLPPSAEEKNAVVRLVRKCAKHPRTTCRTVLHSLIISLRWLSSRHSQIGHGLMAICLPKRSVEESERTGHMLMIAGPPSDLISSFVYVSATGSAVTFGPHFVGGRSVLTDFKAGNL